MIERNSCSARPTRDSGRRGVRAGRFIVRKASSTRVILLTGITGNLGAFAALEFLRRGDKVYAIARSRGGFDLCRRRVLRNLRVISPDERDLRELLRNLELLQADITDEGSIAALNIPERIDQTWHFASSLKYMPKDREEIFSANVDGLKNILRLHGACRGEGANFFYISTAYLSGKNSSLVPEARLDYDEEMSFNNDYEISKLVAEGIFLDAVDSGEVRGAVFRPSIVIGDRHTGRLVNYNGYYLVVKAWHNLCKSMKEIGERDRLLRIDIDPDNKLNLIPINDVIDAMIEIADGDFNNGDVFNVVNEDEITLRQGFDALEKSVGYELRSLCQPSVFDASPKSRYEKLVSYALTYTSPYMKIRISFASDNVRRVLGRELRVNVYPELLDRLTAAYVSML